MQHESTVTVTNMLENDIEVNALKMTYLNEGNHEQEIIENFNVFKNLRFKI